MDVFEKNLELESAGEDSNGDLLAMMDTVKGQLVSYEAGNLILTDDKAPVELLSMKVIDELIKDEVTYYKGIYEEKGFQGLLEYF